MFKCLLKVTWMFFDYWLTCCRRIIFDNKEVNGLEFYEDERLNHFDKQAARLEKIFNERNK